MDNKQLKKRSRQGALISGLGFLVVLAAFALAAVQLGDLNDEIAVKSAEVVRLDDEHEMLDSTVQYLDSLADIREIQIEDKRALIHELIEEINHLKSPHVQPHTSAEKVSGAFDNHGRQLYDIDLWITSSQHTLNQIDSVRYGFEHVSFFMKHRTSSQESNGFAVGYRGWGCVATIKVTVFYQNGEEEVIYFEMCDELGWS